MSNHNDRLVSSSFIDSLKEKQIEDTGYYISIPTGYFIKENRGPDFSVFYLVPIDTTVNVDFSGGLYFGNFPGKFPPPNDSCKVEMIKGEIFSSNADWTVFDCGKAYSIQAIVTNRFSTGWNNQIHAFGHGTSKSELYKILYMFATLNKK
jgi:hypothetical protein